MLIMFGGAAAAQQLPGAPQTAAAPKPAAKPAVKKTAKKTPPKPKSPIARDLFGAASEPAPLAARSVGGYAKGCLAGGVALPLNGPDWQVMRLSRNRNWGNPRLVDYSNAPSDAHAFDGWPVSRRRMSHRAAADATVNIHHCDSTAISAHTPCPTASSRAAGAEDMIAVSMLSTFASIRNFRSCT